MDRWEYAEALAKLFCEGRHTRKTFPDFVNAREGTDYGEDELFKLIDVRLYYGKFDQSVSCASESLSALAEAACGAGLGERQQCRRCS